MIPIVILILIIILILIWLLKAKFDAIGQNMHEFKNENKVDESTKNDKLVFFLYFLLF